MLPRGARGAGSSRAGSQAGSGEAAAKVQLGCPVLGRCPNLSILLGVAAWSPREGKVEENVSVIPAPCTAADGTKLRHHERAQLLEPSCTPRTGATETITAAIKKKRSWGQGKARTSPFVSPQELLQHRWGGGSWLVRCQHPRASGRKGLKCSVTGFPLGTRVLMVALSLTIGQTGWLTCPAWLEHTVAAQQ